MSQIPRSVHPFVDLEARVDDHSPLEEEEESGPDGFIDDDEDEEIDEGQPQQHLLWMNPADREEGLHGFLDGIFERSRDARQGVTIAGNSIGDALSSVVDTRRSPTLSDYPLWRVACRLGSEEDIVFYLLQMALSLHQLRSAFTRGSIRGWIYLETKMNESLIQLLKCTPGIIQRRNGLTQEQIGFDDWTRMLTMSNAEISVAVGKWVRVCRGIYKGDIGYVSAIESWGGVSLLLVPRLQPPQPAGMSASKRKRGTAPPEPELFDPVTVRRNYGWNPVPVHLADSRYVCNQIEFEHGLILKTFDLHSVSSNLVNIPTHLFSLLQRSRHPRLLTSKFPRPLEWIFEEGEKVVIFSSGTQAVVKAVGTDAVEVELNNGVGVASFSWLDLRKHFAVGDFVEVTSGSLCGHTGWVAGVKDETVSIVQHIAGRKEYDVSNTIKMLEVHINWLKTTSPPVQHVPEHGPNEPAIDMRHGRVPWIGTEVIVSRFGHPLKGYRGVVKDVLFEQETSSRLRVAVQLAHLDPLSPFKTEVFDYDDMVEASLQCKLLDFENLKSKHFESRNYVPQPPRQLLASSSGNTGNTTPLPDWSPSSTPAWDPSSRTPFALRVDDSTPLAPSPSSMNAETLPPGPSCVTSQPSVQHPLLNLQLQGTQLKVLVNGGKFNHKELVASPVSVDGQLSIRHTIYNTSEYLPPNWVSPKHPNPTRDNGLLVVIEGEHCGKYVRRIYHEHTNKEIIMILAVVERTASAPDTLTGEQIKLAPNHLCASSETKDEKSRNDTLMLALREKARKTRAK